MPPAGLKRVLDVRVFRVSAKNGQPSNPDKRAREAWDTSSEWLDSIRGAIREAQEALRV